MDMPIKHDESFRVPYRFSNSPEALARFPLPFPEDSYMYSVNLEPHVRVGTGVFANAFDIDEHYVTECTDRAMALSAQPGVHYVSLPHMMQAQWDVMELIMESYARDFPQHFELRKNGAEWTWTNRLLRLEDTFTFGNPASLPMEPFEYISRQAQGDWVLLEERDQTLYIGAGMTTERADYSIRFDLGMSWNEFHGPVPLAHEMGVFERALKFMLRLRTNHPVRRLNWTTTVFPRLETSAETLPDWGPNRTMVTPENAGDAVHLRVELQPLHRLPRSNAIVFPIRTYLAPLAELVTVPGWGKRLHRVMNTLHQDLIDYKGMTRYHAAMVQYLSQFDDGAK
jgi:dimethylamine monooxygenase subunit A